MLPLSVRANRGMSNERNEALKAFLAAFDERLEAAPLVERREQTDRRARSADKPVDGRRAKGPVTDPFAYWDSKPTD